MKSFLAWSRDRLSRELGFAQEEEAGRQAEAAAHGDELDGIAQKLLEGMPLYGVLECATKQREILGNWVQDQSALVTSSVETQVREVKLRLMRAMAEIVGPIVKESLRAKAVEEVCGMLESKFSNILPQDTVVRVPVAMHPMFVTELSRRGLVLSTEPVDEDELVLQVADTRIETQTKPAIQSLERILTT